MGGITTMTADEEFPADSDLDMMLVVDGPTVSKAPIDELYQGVAIEAGLRGREDYASAERVLANPEVADHIARSAIIADPQGLLAAVQPEVAREFSRTCWVTARCEEEKRRFEEAFNAALQAELPAMCLLQTLFAVHNAASLIAVALLVPTTHRKVLIRFREQVRSLQCADLSDLALGACGTANLSKEQVVRYLDATAVAFDRAVEVRQTPSPFDFKLKPHLRPYLIDSLRPMIEDGAHREVMPWVAAGLFLSASTLLSDAPPDERPVYGELLESVVADLGFSSPEARADRLRLAVQLRDAVGELASEVVARRPDELVTA